MSNYFKDSWINIFPPSKLDSFPTNLSKMLTYSNKICIVIDKDKGEQKISIDFLSTMAKKHLDFKQVALEFRCRRKAN